MGDLDNDGRLDAVISHVNEPVAMLRNCVGRHGPWLGIELAARRPRDAAGARLLLETSAGRMVRIVKAGGGYLSTQDRRVVFGLRQATPRRLTVQWPSGRRQTWDQAALKTNRYLRLEEPAPDAP